MTNSNRDDIKSVGKGHDHIRLSKEMAKKHPDTVERLSKHELIFSLSGLFVGFTCIIAGCVLLLNHVYGSTSWTAKILGAESNIINAAPGVVLFIVGLFVVLITKRSILIK